MVDSADVKIDMGGHRTAGVGNNHSDARQAVSPSLQPLSEPLLLNNEIDSTRTASRWLPRPNGPLTLLTLPEDAAVAIISYLSARDVGRLATVSRVLRARADEAALWTHLFTTDFDMLPREKKSLAADPKTLYRTRVQQLHTRIAADAETRANQQSQKLADVKRVKLELCSNLYSVFTFLIAPAALLLAFFVLLSRKLDDAISVSWWVVGVPLFAMCVLLVAWLVMAITQYCASKRTTAPSSVMFGFRSGAVEVVQAIKEHPRCKLWLTVLHTACTVLTFIAVPVVLMAWAAAVSSDSSSSSSNFPLAAALVPVWLLMLLLVCAPCCYKTDDAPSWLTVALVLLIPMLVTLILVCVNVDAAAGIDWTKVFIPIWILMGIFFLAIACGWIVSLVKLIRGREYSLAACGVLCGLFCVLVPLFLSALFLVLLLDDVREFTWIEVFAPFGVWLSGITLAVVIFAVVGIVKLCQDTRSKQRALVADPFAV